jgi:hypothetical protein
VGDTIDVVVTATNATGSGSATSSMTAAVTPLPPTNTAPPAVTGVPEVAQTLTASHGSWSHSPTSYRYQWQDCVNGTCTNIAGATSSSYTVQTSDVGATIDVIVTATNAGGSVSHMSARTGVVTGGGGSSGGGIHVVGSQLQDANGSTIALHGVERSGPEYACEQGIGFTDGPSGNTEMAAIASWTGMNSVALMLNEDCWLGINGVPAAYGGQTYVNFVKSEVAAAEANDLIPILSFMWGAAGKTKATNQEPLPDNDHSPLFFQQLANTFKGDPNVIFRLQEEPHNDGGQWGLADWVCWTKGDVQYADSSSLTPVSQTANCHESYPTVGMQSVLNIIRGTGATNVVQESGEGWADMLSCSTTESPVQCGILDSADGIKLNDPAGQLMTSVNVYPNTNVCGNVTCYNDTYAPVIAVMPLGGGELSPDGGVGTTAAVDTFMNWFDQHGAGYSAKAWDTWSDLLASYNGTPASPWGTDYKAHLAALG